MKHSPTLETIQSGDLTGTLQVIRDTYLKPSGTDADALQRRLFDLAMPVLEAAAAKRLSVTIAWPAGVEQAARATIRAQLVDELTKAAQGSLFAMAATTPRIASALAVEAVTSAAKGSS